MTSQYPNRREFLTGIAALVGFGAVDPIGTLESYAYAGKRSRQKSRKKLKEETSREKRSREIREANYRDFSRDSNQVLLAKMLFGEARSCTDLEKVAIAYTALNRINDGINWNGRTLTGVILTPGQYQCFDLGNANRIKLKRPQDYEREAYKQCLKVAGDILTGRYKDPTSGATNYIDLRKMEAPAMFERMKRIGKIQLPDGSFSIHDFYKRSLVKN